MLSKLHLHRLRDVCRPRGIALVLLTLFAGACSGPVEEGADEQAMSELPPEPEQGDFSALGIGEGPPPAWAAFLADPDPDRVRSLEDLGEAEDEEDIDDLDYVEDEGEFGSVGQALGCIGCYECANADVIAYNDDVQLNGTRRSVKVKYVYYWVQDGILGTGWVKEDLSNQYITPDNRHHWYNEDLNEAKDSRLYNWAVYYRIRKPNGNYTNTVYEIVTPSNSGDVCETDTWYHLRMKQHWTL